MKTLSHSELVARAARWLWNTCGCNAVLTEMSSYTGEIPDAIGWKPNGRSLLVECKTSRADFRADGEKEWRKNPLVALGAERYYFCQPGIIKPEELPEGWGLAELKGNGVHIVVHCRPRKDLRSDLAKGYEMRMLVAAIGRTAARLQPVQLNEWLKYENRDQSLAQMQTWVTREDHDAFNLASQGWEPMVNPQDLPLDPVTEEAWCPKHEMLFEKCACVGPGEQFVEYREIDGKPMARPMAMHCGKFPPISDLDHHAIEMNRRAHPDGF